MQYGCKHCGRCVPCMVRRAAFTKADVEDSTIYVHNDLSASGAIKASGANDIGAVASAYIKCQSKGIERIIGGSLSFSGVTDRKKYAGIVERGLQELGTFLEEQDV